MERIDASQLEINPFTMIGKDCFLITAGNMSEWNTMTAAWGGLGYIWNKPSVIGII